MRFHCSLVDINVIIVIAVGERWWSMGHYCGVDVWCVWLLHCHPQSSHINGGESTEYALHDDYFMQDHNLIAHRFRLHSEHFPLIEIDTMQLIVIFAISISIIIVIAVNSGGNATAMCHHCW